jgi:prophage regulatory protein
MRIISYDELKPAKGISYSKVQLWRLEKQNKFPKRVPLSPNRSGWVEAEIDDWLASKIAERDGRPVEAA